MGEKPYGARGSNDFKQIKWWAMRDSNSRHPRCKRGALPTELIALSRVEPLSAASVGVIYALPAKTARGFARFFLIFLRAARQAPGTAHRWRCGQICEGEGAPAVATLMASGGKEGSPRRPALCRFFSFEVPVDQNSFRHGFVFKHA